MEGEVCDECLPILVALQDEVAGLQQTIRSQGGLLGKYARENDDDLRRHAEWERGRRLFKVWQRATGKTRSRWSINRFKAAKPFLETYEDELILRAIEGIAYDPMVASEPRKNGTGRDVFNDWETLFKSDAAFERYCNKAPRTWKDDLIEHTKEIKGLDF